jgi:hypothetical protein
MTRKTRSARSKKGSQQDEFPAAKLDELIEEATVDAHYESEQTTGFYTMFEEYLALPFKTEVLSVEVTVERIDMTDDATVPVSVSDRARGGRSGGPAAATSSGRPGGVAH